MSSEIVSISSWEFHQRKCALFALIVFNSFGFYHLCVIALATGYRVCMLWSRNQIEMFWRFTLEKSEHLQSMLTWCRVIVSSIATAIPNKIHILQRLRFPICVIIIISVCLVRTVWCYPSLSCHRPNFSVARRSTEKNLSLYTINMYTKCLERVFLQFQPHYLSLDLINWSCIRATYSLLLPSNRILYTI